MKPHNVVPCQSGWSISFVTSRRRRSLGHERNQSARIGGHTKEPLRPRASVQVEFRTAAEGGVSIVLINAYKWRCLRWSSASICARRLRYNISSSTNAIFVDTWRESSIWRAAIRVCSITDDIRCRGPRTLDLVSDR